MKNFYKSYLRAFEKYAQTILTQYFIVRSITAYALALNLKAEHLLRRASLNKLINLQKFQKEMFEMGRDYVRTLAIMLSLKKGNKNTPETTSADQHGTLWRGSVTGSQGVTKHNQAEVNGESDDFR